ncbi:TPA: hypothetical protein HA273_01135 [Candidatus Bathyarchaeota archaeon]|nr:hypothetical protein [Candidatus Bathyarchaeota archaeon]HIJ07772.1 hypothetical protein [Candidatus Bathyarchaeota archaeon]
MVVAEILKVFYAPHKVFKEIVQNPKYLGPLLILIIFTAAQTGFIYARESKIYYELTLPTGLHADTWTENATFWQASVGAVISNNYVDFINGTSSGARSIDYYGNCSIEFELDNSQTLQIALPDLDGSVDCSETGFQNISFRVKTITPEINPQSATLFLYSLGDSNYFSYDLTETFSKTEPHIWNNITVPVGSTEWSSSNSAASWQNITSLMMELTWSNASNIRLLVDGLFFRGVFKNGVEVNGIQTLLLYYAVPTAAISFALQWLLLTALMYFIIKGLKGNIVWKQLLVAVGFALVILIVQALILLATYSFVTQFNIPLEYFSGVPGESEIANKAVVAAMAQVNLISGGVQVAFWIWTIGLAAFIVRTVPITSPVPLGEDMAMPKQLSWTKCLLVSAASFVLTIIIMAFVGA